MLLVLGSTGLLGQAVMGAADDRGIEAVGAARSGADRTVDVREVDTLRHLCEEIAPAAVVNCVALVDLAGCENDSRAAYEVNARPVAALAEWTRAAGSRLVQVSTDHYWTGDANARHDESAPVRLINEYARTKLAGEGFALIDRRSLVVRTNIVGMRGWEGRPTFAEWAIDALEAGEPMTLFEDFFTSSIDAASCAAAILDALDAGATGILNIASAEVASKREFVEALARVLELPLPEVTSGSVKGMQPPRAESLGLDVARAEALLGRSLPTLDDTVAALAGVHASAR